MAEKKVNEAGAAEEQLINELMKRVEQLEGGSKAEEEKAEAEYSERKEESLKLMEERVPVRLAYDTSKGDSVFACVNGRAIQIKRGERVEIPKAFDEVLRNAEEQSEEAARLISRRSS